jgi:plasmid stabilization system protein ParE
MSYKRVFLQTALEEYESSLFWYAERSTLAADQFVDEVRHAILLVCEYPDRWRNEFEEYFEIRVKKYPYTIVYTIDPIDEVVYIHSIHHQSQNPQKKYKK